MSIKLHSDVEKLKLEVEDLKQSYKGLDKATLLEVNALMRKEIAKLAERVLRLESKRG